MKALAILTAVVALLVALASFAPASLLDAKIEQATQGQLRLVEASGTVWDGRGALTGATRTWTLPLRWSVSVRSLLRGEPEVVLHAVDGGDSPRGTIGWRNAPLTLEGVAFMLPASALNGALLPANTVAIGGNISVDVPHASWNGHSFDGTATVRWNGARVASSTAGPVALGTVTMTAAPRDGRVQGSMESRGGDVRVDGVFALDDAGISGSATITPSPSTPPTVVRALGTLGTPDASGAVRVTWRSGNR